MFLFIAICQIPNLKNNFALQPYGTWMILLSVIMYALSYPLISMILIHGRLRAPEEKSSKRLFDILALAVAVLFIFSLAKTRSFADSLMKFSIIRRRYSCNRFGRSIASAAVNVLLPNSGSGLWVWYC